MRCPVCSATELRVIDTTNDPERDEIRRRRECSVCGRRFTTVERMRSTLPLVVKSSVQGDAPARREPFDRAKLRHGIALACAKRPIPPATIDRLVDDIEARLEAMNAEAVPSHAIGEMVIDALRELDGIAYIRYAIVFLGLDDLAALRREIDRLLYERSARGGPPVRG